MTGIPSAANSLTSGYLIVPAGSPATSTRRFAGGRRSPVPAAGCGASGPRSSTDSDTVTPGRTPFSTAALCSQFRRQDSLIPTSLAICAIGASPRRATATTSSRNSLGRGLGMVNILPAGPHGPTDRMPPTRAAVPSGVILPCQTECDGRHTSTSSGRGGHRRGAVGDRRPTRPPDSGDPRRCPGVEGGHRRHRAVTPALA